MSEKKARRRGEVLERAVLDAAWLELRERGWLGFTVEGVSTRSGVAKTVMYRRWKNRADLVQDMLNRSAADEPELLSCGVLRDDLVSLLEVMCEFLRGPFGQAIRGAMSESDAGGRPSVFGADPVVFRLQGMVDAAVGRGDLAGQPTSLALNVGHSVVMWEFLATGVPPESGDLRALVDGVWLPALRQQGW